MGGIIPHGGAIDGPCTTHHVSQRKRGQSALQGEQLAAEVVESDPVAAAVVALADRLGPRCRLDRHPR